MCSIFAHLRSFCALLRSYMCSVLLLRSVALCHKHHFFFVKSGSANLAQSERKLSTYVLTLRSVALLRSVAFNLRSICAHLALLTSALLYPFALKSYSGNIFACGAINLEAHLLIRVNS